MRYIAEFQPEAWVKDNAIPVDPEGKTKWDCTAFVEANKDLKTKINEALKKNNESFAAPFFDRDDVLKGDPAAPAWIRDWSGPFTITVWKGTDTTPHIIAAEQHSGETNIFNDDMARDYCREHEIKVPEELWRLTSKGRLIEAAKQFQKALAEATKNGVLDAMAAEDMSGGPDQLNALCDAVAEIAKL